MVVRADVFQKTGGFAPELGPGGIGVWEDTEISLRMRQAGCRMIYAPQILVRHQWARGRLTKSFFRANASSCMVASTLTMTRSLSLFFDSVYT